MTPEQIKLIHIAKRDLDLSDQAYRLILSNVAGVTSCTQLSNTQFEQVMAILESQGFRHRGKSEDYYRSKVEHASERANARQLHLIAELASLTSRGTTAEFVESSQSQITHPAPIWPAVPGSGQGSRRRPHRKRRPRRLAQAGRLDAQATEGQVTVHQWARSFLVKEKARGCAYWSVRNRMRTVERMLRDLPKDERQEVMAEYRKICRRLGRKNSVEESLKKYLRHHDLEDMDVRPTSTTH